MGFVGPFEGGGEVMPPPPDVLGLVGDPGVLGLVGDPGVLGLLGLVGGLGGAGTNPVEV